MYVELKRLSEKDDLSKLSISKIDWDVEIGGISQQLVRITDRAHGEGGEYGINEYYVYPLREEMSVKNLTPYWGLKGGIAWGIHFEYKNYFRPGNGFNKDSQIRENGSCWITRNGKKFYEVSGIKHEYALAKAQALIVELSECGIEFYERNWEAQVIGKKVWYHNQPAKIKRVVKEQGCFILEPDGIDFFEPEPYSYDDEEERKDWINDYGIDLKVEFLSSNIHWFRK